MKTKKEDKKREKVNELLHTGEWATTDDPKRLISIRGEVFSLTTMRILKPNTGKNGYKQVTYCGRIEYVHRLVAQAFIPNPDNLPFIDHINTIRDDNRVENLRWVDAKGNSNNPITKSHTDGQFKKGSIPPNKRQVSQYTLDGVLLKVYDSLTEAAEDNNMRRTDISNVLRGVQKTAKGFIWK